MAHVHDLPATLTSAHSMRHFALLNGHGVPPRLHVALIATLLAGCSGSIYAQRTPNPTPLSRAVPPVQSGTPSKPPAREIHAFDVAEASLTELQAALGDGRVSSLVLVDAYLARIAAFDHRGPSLNALIRLNPRARADARLRDAERRAGHVRGPLHGIPIILKDNYDTGDMPTSGGSLALAASQPSRDGFVVRQLRNAGAIVLAKANLHELAAGITSISSLGGQTRNPYDVTRCPGGSSGGTAVAIAASFAAVGWGSDTCGSIRIPSAFNNLVGLRPTQGLVSRSGIMPLSHTQDIGGPLARTVTDLAIALDASVGVDSTDVASRFMAGRPTPHFVAALDRSALRGARLGMLMPYFLDTDAEIADTVRSALQVMKRAGADVMEVRIPEFDSLMAGSSVLNMETRSDLMAYLQGVPNAPVHSMHDILASGLYDRALEARFRLVDTIVGMESDAYRRAVAKQAALRARISAVMDSLSLDALVYPTVRQKPTLIGDAQAGSTCQLSAHSGLPALSAAAGFTADGLPVGIELLGRAFTDARLVALAFAFEQTGSRRRAPATTPSLMHRPSIVAPAIRTVARGTDATATADFRFEPSDNRLSWTVRVSGAVPKVLAVVLRRMDADSGGVSRVIARLVGPGMARMRGVLPLNATEHRALNEGRLRLALYETAHPTRPTETRIRLR